MWKFEQLGLIEYQEAFEYQEKLVKQKQEGDKNNYFLLMEHPPTYTKGRGAKDDNILDKSIPVHIINRGGDLTYHEPGQLVGYIILDLRKEKLGVKQFISKIEELIIDSVKPIELNAYKHPDLIGVWAENKKIASIGVTIKKGVTMHGFGLNVCNNLKGFNKINPCGLSAEDYASVEQLIEKKISVDTIQAIVIENFKNIF